MDNPTLIAKDFMLKTGDVQYVRQNKDGYTVDIVTLIFKDGVEIDSATKTMLVSEYDRREREAMRARE